MQLAIKTYEILYSGNAIRCLICKMVSWNRRDIQELFCANCHKFHRE